MQWKPWLLLETNISIHFLDATPNWYLANNKGLYYSSLTGTNTTGFWEFKKAACNIASIYDFHMKHNSI